MTMKMFSLIKLLKSDVNSMIILRVTIIRFICSKSHFVLEKPHFNMVYYM